MLARGSMLGQSRPTDTSTATIFTATVTTEVTSIAVCNTEAGAAKMRLHHDQNGTTYDKTNALHYDETVQANSTLWIASDSQGSGILMEPGDSLGVRTDTSSTLTFTIYGVTVDLAPKLNKRG